MVFVRKQKYEKFYSTLLYYYYVNTKMSPKVFVYFKNYPF